MLFYKKLFSSLSKIIHSNKALIFIFFFSLFLRIFNLNDIPSGFHADEARVGWNSLSILKTGRDDRGNFFNLYYNTFGDYRPTGIFYLTIPSILLFGTNEFSVRLPSALIGALTIFSLYFLTKELGNSRRVSLLSAFLLAISPWHLSLSRGTSEAIISLFFSLFGIFFLIKGVSKNKKYFFYSFVFLSFSYFFYHPIRILAPLFILIILLYYRGQLINLKKISILFFLCVSLTTLLFSFDKRSSGRFRQVSIFNDLDVQYELSKMPFEEGPNKVFVARFFHNKLSTYSRKFISEYSKYFSPDFLISTTAKPKRYTSPGMGVLTYFEYFLFILGLIVVLKKTKFSLPLILLLISPIPAALTTEDSPNLHRTIFMIPFFVIITTYGLNSIWESKLYKKYYGLILGALLLNFIFFLHMYFVHSKVNIPLYRNVGAKELAIEISSLQEEYDRIIITNIPDDPYPWIGFFTNRNPKIFNKDAVTREKGTWTSQNLIFTGLRCPSQDAFKTPEVKRLLVIDAEGCYSESKIKGRPDIKLLKQIKRPDGSEVYTFWSRTE